MKAPNEVKAFININVPEKFPNAPVVYSTDGKTSTSTGYMLGKGFSHDYNNQVLGKDVTARSFSVLPKLISFTWKPPTC
jgi:hypothetical protein